MQRGRLNTRIEIIQNTAAADGQGGFTSTWTNYATRWAEVKPIKAMERFKDGQIENPIEVIFRLQYDSAITETMRVRYDGKQYEIRGLVNMSNADTELEISAVLLRV